MASSSQLVVNQGATLDGGKQGVLPAPDASKISPPGKKKARRREDESSNSGRSRASSSPAESEAGLPASAALLKIKEHVGKRKRRGSTASNSSNSSTESASSSSRSPFQSFRKLKGASSRATASTSISASGDWRRREIDVGAGLGLQPQTPPTTNTALALEREPVAKVIMPPVVPLGGHAADLSTRQGVTVIEPNREQLQEQQQLTAQQPKTKSPEQPKSGGEQREKGEKKRHKRGKHSRSSSTREVLPLHALVARRHRPSLSVGGSASAGASPEPQSRTLSISHTQPQPLAADADKPEPLSAVVPSALPTTTETKPQQQQQQQQPESKRSLQAMPSPLHSATVSLSNPPALKADSPLALTLPSPPAAAAIRVAFSPDVAESKETEGKESEARQRLIDAYTAKTPKQASVRAGANKLGLVRSLVILLVLWLAIVLSAFSGVSNSPTASVAVTSIGVVLYLGLFGGTR
jgi:hypothetical protein